MTFTELGICSQIVRALEEQYQAPSIIQEKAIPPILAGHDLLGCAQTGSGKTAAFAVPVLQNLAESNQSGKKKIRALVLTPTRELAIQIDENFAAYGRYLPLSCSAMVGGVNQKQQEAMLSRGIDILTATPGRLCDLMGQGIIDLSAVEILVLDEADRMLDMGFIDSVRKITAKLKPDRQTLLFSATMPKEIINLVNSLLHDYERVEAAPVSSTVQTISQRLYYVDNPRKKDLLLDILADEAVPYALVFTRTKHGADALARYMIKAGVSCASIHGNKSQNARQRALHDFETGAARLLIATEIAARGIDIKGLPYVFNFNMPEEAEMYVHRIGRTGRAGADGVAISFCCFEEMNLLEQIEKLIKKKIPVVENHRFPMEELTVHPKEERRKFQNDRQLRERSKKKPGEQPAKQQATKERGNPSNQQSTRAQTIALRQQSASEQKNTPRQQSIREQKNTLKQQRSPLASVQRPDKTLRFPNETERLEQERRWAKIRERSGARGLFSNLSDSEAEAVIQTEATKRTEPTKPIPLQNGQRQPQENRKRQNREKQKPQEHFLGKQGHGSLSSENHYGYDKFHLTRTKSSKHKKNPSIF